MGNGITFIRHLIGSVRLIGMIAFVYWLARSVVKPDPHEHLHWYDRVIRAMGVLIFASVLLFGIPRWFGWVK